MTRDPLTPLTFPVALLNSGPYQDPDGAHTYVISGGRWHLMHVDGCPALDERTSRREVVGTYNDVANVRRFGCQRCQPHRWSHVTLPDGTKRYRPMGPILSGGDDSDPRYGEYALVDQADGRWQVREWAATGQAALDRAAKLGITVILGPPNAELGLPTPLPNA